MFEDLFGGLFGGKKGKMGMLFGGLPLAFGLLSKLFGKGSGRGVEEEVVSPQDPKKPIKFSTRPRPRPMLDIEEQMGTGPLDFSSQYEYKPKTSINEYDKPEDLLSNILKDMYGR